MRCPGNKKHQGSGNSTRGKVYWLSGWSSFRCVRPLVVLPCVWALVLWLLVLPGGGCWCLLPAALASAFVAAAPVFLVSGSYAGFPKRKGDVPGTDPVVFARSDIFSGLTSYIGNIVGIDTVGVGTCRVLSPLPSSFSIGLPLTGIHVIEHTSLRVLVSQCRVGAPARMTLPSMPLL